MSEPLLILGDNLQVLCERRDELPKFTLAYLDPPFRTGHDQSGPAGSYSDDALPMPQYVESVVRVAASCAMSATYNGSIVVHVDPKTSHYVKVGLDAYFGADHFASEIVWRYRRWPAKTKNFQRVHDVLLRYVMHPGDHVWNQLFEPLADSTMRTFGAGKQRAVFVKSGQRTGKRQELLRLKSEATAELSPGVPMGDVWDIGIVAPSGHERTGYPTQKPEALLERLILATTNPGDFVLEPYLGSGTAMAVAKRLGRRGVGIDRNPEAIEVASKRLLIGQDVT